MRNRGTRAAAVFSVVVGLSCGSSGSPQDTDPLGASDGVPKASEDSEVVAHIGTESVLTLSELTAEIEAMPPSLRRQFATRTGRRELVEAQIDKRLLAAEARRRGLADREDVRSQVLALEERLIVRALLEQEEMALRAVSDRELHEHFEETRHSLPRRDDGRVPSFEEAREEVLARMDARRRRQVFDDLVESLRAEVDVKVNEQVLH